MTGIVVRQVISRRDRQEFIRLPWSIYKGDPNWVPPLILDMKDRMDEKRNPVFRHMKAAYFLAEKGGRTVGRVSASVDENFVRFQDRKAGHFGFFEAENDADVARALLTRAEEWVRGQGMVDVIGPAAYGGNDDNYGCLTEGFGQAVFMHAYNPPYYARLIEAAGYAKVRELWAYYLEAAGAQAPPQIQELAAHLEREEGVVVRPMDKKNLARELEFYREIYNAAWARNWGFCPMEKEEFDHHAQLLRFVIDPELALFCEVRGVAAGAALTLPNLNEAFAKMNGRVLPLGALTLLYMLKRRKIRGCRVFTLGVKPEFRRLGVGAVFYVRTMETVKRLGYRWGDMSWILDNNDAMNRAIQAMGGTIWRRWNMYEKKG
jgi:GNAT superfamily N-acetyltransferase